MDKKYSLGKLFRPIFLETFCMMLAGTADTLMLSSVGDLAVGAAGTANTYINLLIILFNITSMGMMAVMTQYIGAGRKRAARQAWKIGLMANTVLGVGMSLFLFFGSGFILSVMGVAPSLADPTRLYLRIVGGGCLTNALIPIFSNQLRAFGHTQKPFMAALAGNVLNVALNAYYLYVRHAGIEGVAVAAVLSRVVQLALVALLSARLDYGKETKKPMPPGVLLGQILQIGVPSACENIVYSLSVTLIVSLLNQMDPSGFHIAARTYALQITSFSHCASSSFGHHGVCNVSVFVHKLEKGKLFF